MNYWITTDTHFNHENVMCTEDIGRPLDYADRIYKGLSNIPARDTLIHLGDICIGEDKKMHDKYIVPLKCKKILVAGNHDKKSNNWYMNNGWDFVCEQFVWKLDGKRIVFSHKPIGWDGECDINIHGHLHNCQHRDMKTLSFNKLLSLELHGYQPKTISHFLDKIV